MKKILLETLVLCSTLTLQTHAYFSQFGQDQFLNENYFKNKTNGVFVDIGAHDGVTFNTTYFFERDLHWQGICVEPLPQSYEKLKSNRKCLCLNAQISDFNGEHDYFHTDSDLFIYYSKLCGFIKKSTANQIECLRNFLHNRLQEKHRTITQTTHACFTLESLLKAHNIKHVDYLHVSNQGSEYTILAIFDFKTFDINVIEVENSYNDKRIKELLERNGYTLIRNILCTEIYKKTT